MSVVWGTHTHPPLCYGGHRPYMLSSPVLQNKAPHGHHRGTPGVQSSTRQRYQCSSLPCCGCNHLHCCTSIRGALQLGTISAEYHSGQRCDDLRSCIRIILDINTSKYPNPCRLSTEDSFQPCPVNNQPWHNLVQPVMEGRWNI